jgi:hypothetical protein
MTNDKLKMGLNDSQVSGDCRKIEVQPGDTNFIEATMEHMSVTDSAGYIQLARRLIRQSIVDATRTARRGVEDERNEALAWLWDVGRQQWAEVLEDEHYKLHLGNVCEEISILADARRSGKRYDSLLLRRELQRRDTCQNVTNVRLQESRKTL